MSPRRAPSILLALALAGAASLGGCEAITGPSELERKIAAEQEVIAAYSAKVLEVDALQKAFVADWTKANEHKDLKVYKEDLEANVLPALQRYVEAAEAMPTGSEELAGIHAGLVAAYKSAQAEFVAFVAGLTEANCEQGHQAVLAKMDEVKQAEAAYLDRLRTYYAKNRVDLVKEP